MDRSTARLAVLVLATAVAPPAAAMRSLHVAELSETTAVVDLGGIWLFRPGDDPAFAHPMLDDSDWEQRLVPTAMAASRQRRDAHGWYRLHFAVGTNAVGADRVVSLGRAREAVEIYWNGSLIGRRGRFGARAQGGERSTPLLAFVPALLIRPGDNVLAVRVDDPALSGGLVAGPLLLGPPYAIDRLTARERVLWPSAHLALAALVLVVGLGRLAFARGGWARREGGWLALAGVGLAFAHLGETALLAVISPALDLLPRLPSLGALTASLGFAGLFAARHDDPRAPRVVWGRAGFVAALAALLLAPDAFVHGAGAPLVFLASLVATLYSASLVALAVRRKEEGALPVFVSLVGLAVLLVLDGIAAGGGTVPHASLVGGVLVFLVVSFTGARSIFAEHENALARVEDLEERLDGGRMGILDATALSVTDRGRFLDAVVHEIVRGMGVHRCSLVLAESGGLAVAAAVGLPKHLRSTSVPTRGSIAGWVFTQRRPLSDTTLPEDLARTPGSGSYATRAFLSYPVLDGRSCLGVLNVSDRLDAGPFGARDEEAMAAIAQKLAVVLRRLGGR